MIFEDFAQAITKATGLDFGTAGVRALERAVEVRIAATGLKTAEAYAVHLKASHIEFQELVETVLVTESWFYRDREAFIALVGIAREMYLRDPAPLRLLSLGCSTGEEPYSMAMALLDAGFPPGSFRIEAVDISYRAITFATRGVYASESFRPGDLEFRDRYFADAGSKGHRLADRMRDLVRFRQANLLADGALPETEAYDIVFFRNALHHLTDAARDAATGLVRRVLKPEGVVFVGPSETGILLDHGFVSTRIPLAFAFRKEMRPRRLTEGRGRKPGRPVELPAQASAGSEPPPAFGLRPRRSPEDAAASLKEIRELTKKGLFVEANVQCEAHLRLYGASSDILYLMALMRDARGDLREAAKYYRRTLELNPDHSQAGARLDRVVERQKAASDAAAKARLDVQRQLDAASLQPAEPSGAAEEPIV
jgi:chemotaxis protein methyltransferase WspC